MGWQIVCRIFHQIYRNCMTNSWNHQRHISDDTVCWCLTNGNVHSALSQITLWTGPVFMACHCNDQLRWARQHQRALLPVQNHSFFQTKAETVSTAGDRLRVWQKWVNIIQMTVHLKVSRGGPSIIVLGAIVLNQRASPVVSQNIGSERGNGVTASCYINQTLRPHLGCNGNVFQRGNNVPTLPVQQDFLQWLGIQTTKLWYKNPCETRFKEGAEECSPKF